MSAVLTPHQPMPAVISRPGATASYLLLSDAGAADWTADPRRATVFASLREATRIALRLPSNLRAYGLPCGADDDGALIRHQPADRMLSAAMP